MTGFILIILSALFFPGIIIRVKSILSGRKGPGIFQPYRNIFVLLKKGSIYGRTTSYIFQIAPVIYLSTVFCCIFLMPFTKYNLFTGFDGDFILFAYLLALGKFFFIISAMDTGSSFEGMGANREALYSLLAEPGFFISLGTISMLTGYTSMNEIFQNIQFSNNYYFIICVIIIYVLMQIAMIENSRMPVDDPKTHLELTMIHEVMILDHSGFDLALIQIATILKFTLYGTLLANVIIPGNLALWLQLLLYFGIQILFAIIIGLLESFRARKKLLKNPQFIVSLSSISLVAFLLGLLLLNQMLK